MIYTSEHYTNKNIFGDFQQSFRNGKSTISAAAKFLHVAYNKVIGGEKVAGVFLVLTKAFF